MALDGTPFLVQAVYSFKGKNNDEVICVCGYLCTFSNIVTLALQDYAFFCLKLIK